MERIIYDHQLVAFHRSEKENAASWILYYDRDGGHEIDLAACAMNDTACVCEDAKNCIGERHIDKGYIVLYTSGALTKIVFKKKISFYIFWRTSASRKQGGTDASI